MTTKEWLNRGRDLDSNIKALLEARQAVYDKCISMTSTLQHDTIQHDKDPHAKMDKLAEYNRIIDQQVDELIQIKGEILEAIATVDNSTYKTLLIARYVNFKTWEQIAVDMSYSYRHVVMELHPKALTMIKANGGGTCE